MDGGDCNDYCMTMWMTPSLLLYVNVQDALKEERKESCQLHETIVKTNGEDEFIVNGLKFDNSTTDEDYNDLYVPFSKCFDDSSIFNEDSENNLGLFCFFGDFRSDFSGRDIKQNIKTETRL